MVAKPINNSQKTEVFLNPETLASLKEKPQKRIESKCANTHDNYGIPGKRKRITATAH